MLAGITVKLFTASNPVSETLQFFETSSWNQVSEKELIFQIQNLFEVLRTQLNSVSVSLDINVTDINHATFLLKKNLSKKIEINQQKLSIREIEVLGLIMQGLTNHEISEKLFISFETVRSHRKNILEKTGAKNTAALINYYHQTFFEK